mmetsp:Transcript_43035/g.104096  ORF Transcript_43035/g.104096 Transcript_43035/m.104096 type:complete len:93 (+) Transcript_43035:1958-2236(+)
MKERLLHLIGRTFISRRKSNDETRPIVPATVEEFIFCLSQLVTLLSVLEFQCQKVTARRWKQLLSKLTDTELILLYVCLIVVSRLYMILALE